MFEAVLDCIKKYDTIIIHRHSRPDGDAMGSQIGMKHIITQNVPEKKVYAVGDKTEIYNLEHIYRGYENIEEKFRNLGAIIERVKE